MTAGEPPAAPRRSWLAWLASRDLGPLLALVVIVLLFAALDYGRPSGSFASVRNFRIVLHETSIVAVAALGMTIIIISGGIDLSAGTALALSATVAAAMIKAGWPPTTAVAAAILVGMLCGLLNGSLISLLRVPPFIVTLGTMTAFLGVAKIISRETTVYPARSAIPSWLMHLCSPVGPDFYYGGLLPNLAPGLYLGAALAVAVAVLLHQTVFGRHVFAIGSNEATARLCGVHVPLTKVAVYALGGLFFGLAGVYQFADLKQGNPDDGLGMELKIIAAVVIGGGSLSGGRGSVIGALAGALIMAVIRSGCIQLDVSNSYQHIVIGAIIVAAVAVDRFRQARLAAA